MERYPTCVSLIIMQYSELIQIIELLRIIYGSIIFFFIGTIATNEKNFERLAKSITKSNEYNLLSI